MANPGLTALISEVTRRKTVGDSVLKFFSDLPALIAKAKAESIANGATEEELAPLQQLSDDFSAQTNAIVTAIQANTPAAP